MIKAQNLEPGTWFIDPHRAGRRPAYVVEIIGVGREGHVLAVLNDDRPYGPWSASYGLDEELEPCEPHAPITD
jgi:hypothetical protein